MAIVIPYGDAQAHGSIAGSISFRRYRGKVVLQKKPHGKQPNTPGQINQQQKFSDAWKSYHQLNAWEVDYLREKASQLGTTPSNLYISQFLKDEIPSTVPMTAIKEIIDASLPEPIDTENQGIKNEIWSKIISGPVLTLYGDIYDKENVYINNDIAPTHDREYIEIIRNEPSGIVIPANYPLIITWKNYSDIEKVQLIRYPEITLTPGGAPSTTPLTNVKEILSLQLMTPIGTQDFQFGIIFGTHDTVSGEDKTIAIIDDNNDIPINLDSITAFTNFWIQFEGNNSPVQTVPDDYTIKFKWKDNSDVIHEQFVKFPAFSFDAGAPYSSTDLTDIKQIDAMIITNPELPGPQIMNIDLSVAVISPPGGQTLGTVADPTNLFTPGSTVGPISSTTMNIAYYPAGPQSFKQNYKVWIKYLDQSSNPKWTFLVYDALAFPGLGTERYKVFDDFAFNLLDPPYTQIGKSRKNNKRFWLANDMSTYYDMAMTSLAKAGLTASERLYIATDFSLYYDEALTQLASTPFY